MPLPPALVHALKLIAKENYSLATIRNAFIFAGALPEWQDTAPHGGSQREEAVQQWIDGINKHAPRELDRIVSGVVEDMLAREDLDPQQVQLLKRHAGKVGYLAGVAEGPDQVQFPSQISRLLDHLIRHFRRAERPLRNRRKGKPQFELGDEYDVQDLLHSQLRVWISDIRAEEWTPSYTGKASRIDFVLAEYRIAIEVKYVRDAGHARHVGQELEIDIGHYVVHPHVDQLWIVVFDQHGHISNPKALRDLGGVRTNNDRRLEIRSYVVGGHHSPPVVNA
ncbi:MAG TPA: hypothetical protein VHG28_16200 [Longimicrobiaceae bacterium]|nr:hypothetical protein [Longimicrobiaceae bacterium]